MRKIIALLTLALCSMANAESYREIGPLDSLGDVKARLPSAEVKKLSPAWAQPTDSMYQFSGTGLPQGSRSYPLSIYFCAEVLLARLYKTMSCEVKAAARRTRVDVVRVAAGALGAAWGNYRSILRCSTESKENSRNNRQ